MNIYAQTFTLLFKTFSTLDTVTCTTVICRKNYFIKTHSPNSDFKLKEISPLYPIHLDKTDVSESLLADIQMINRVKD